MPRMNGREPANTLQRGYPDIKVLHASGYTANAIANHGIIEEGINFTDKPYNLESPAKKIREILERKKRIIQSTTL